MRFFLPEIDRIIFPIFFGRYLTSVCHGEPVEPCWDRQLNILRQVQDDKAAIKAFLKETIRIISLALFGKQAMRVCHGELVEPCGVGYALPFDKLRIIAHQQSFRHIYTILKQVFGRKISKIFFDAA